MTMHPTGKFAYVTNAAANAVSVSAFNINALTGALTALPSGGTTVTVTEAAPLAMAIDPTGQFAYVANGNSSNVSAYAINRTTGVLTALGGSPFAVPPAGSPAVPASPQGMRVDAAARRSTWPVPAATRSAHSPSMQAAAR